MIKHKKALLLGLVLLFCLAIFLVAINAGINDINSLKNNLRKLGNWAPYVFLVLCMFRSFMLLPCGAFSVAGGLMFGLFKGGILTLLGFTINSVVVYLMAGYFGRDFMQKLLKNKFDAVDEFVNENSFLSFLYLRMVPLLPFDVVSCIGGISRAKLRNFTLATFLGSIPGILVYTYFGSALKTLSLQKAAIPAALIGIMTLFPVIQKFIKMRNKGNKSNFGNRNSTI